MSSATYVITGATGNIGKKLSDILLSRNKKVRVVGRNAARLKSFVDEGAEAFVGSLEDPQATARAFQGAQAVFAMIPPNYTAPNFRAYQNRVGDALAGAVRDNGIRWVVSLSSLGANRPDKVGPIGGLFDLEQHLDELSGVNVLHLRPAYFMENFFMSLDLIKQMGINGSAIRGDRRFAMIATTDIAHAAAEALLRLSFKDKSVAELLGPRDLSMQDATTIMGKAIGKPDLKYVQFPYEDTRKALVGKGFSPDLAQLFIEMSEAINDGLLQPTQGRTPMTTTPTTFEEFAATLAEAYNRGAVAAG
jgi:uncharacterized protein YbjT (DUF2867 family)